MVKLSSALIISTAALSSVSPALSLYLPRSDSSNNDALQARDTPDLFDRYVVDKLTDRELQEREPFLPILGGLAIKYGVKLGVRLGRKVAGRVAGHFLNRGKRSVDEPEIDALITREMGDLMAILEGREPAKLSANLNEPQGSGTGKEDNGRRKRPARVASRKGKYVDERGLDDSDLPVEFERDFDIDALD